MTVVVYSKPNCMQCNFTKEFLTNNQVEFKEIDITQDAAAMAEVKEMGFQTLPVVVADGFEPWFGFRPDMLERLAGD